MRPDASRLVADASRPGLTAHHYRGPDGPRLPLAPAAAGAIPLTLRGEPASRRSSPHTPPRPGGNPAGQREPANTQTGGRGFQKRTGILRGPSILPRAARWGRLSKNGQASLHPSRMPDTRTRNRTLLQLLGIRINLFAGGGSGLLPQGACGSRPAVASRAGARGGPRAPRQPDRPRPHPSPSPSPPAPVSAPPRLHPALRSPHPGSPPPL